MNPLPRVERGLAGLRLDLGIGARERARAVEVGQRHALVGRGERRVVGVLLVGERLVARDCTGFGKNTCAGAVLPAGVGLAAAAAGAIAAQRAATAVASVAGLIMRAG